MRATKLLLIALSLILVGCSIAPDPLSVKPTIYTEGNTLFYDGVIMPNSVLEAIRVARMSDTKVTKLEISSPGGEVESGIEFGYFVHQYQLQVIINKGCFSSCANYVLTAASKVYIKSGAVIGWHGSAHQSDELWMQNMSYSQMKAFKVWLNYARPKESEFFNVIGVDPQITTYGQTKVNSCQKKKMTDGWFYTLSDLAHMGINNLEIEDVKLAQVSRTGKVTSCEMPQLFK